MSIHPNAMLLLTITPDGLARQAMRAIRAEHPVVDDKEIVDDDEIMIGALPYKSMVMESTFDEDYQISGEEGDLIFWQFLTYGAGEQIDWETLVAQHAVLDAWAQDICARHHGTYRISISANYW